MQRARLYAVTLAVFLVGGGASALETFTLENVSIHTKDADITLPRVEFADANVGRDEALMLFSVETSHEDMISMVSRLRASRIAIPEIRVTGKDGELMAHDYVVQGVDSGKFARLDFAGFEGRFFPSGNGETRIRMRPLTIEGADYSRLLDAIRRKEPSRIAGKLGKLTWAGFEATFPNKEVGKTDSTGLVRVSLESLQHTGTYDGDAPLDGRFDLKHLVFEPPVGSTFGKQLADFGYSKIDLGLTAASRYDAKAQTYVLDDMTLTGVDIGSFRVTGTFAGLDPKVLGSGEPAARFTAMSKGQVAKLTLRFANDSIVDRAISYFGRTQNRSPEDIKRQYAGMVTGFGPQVLGGTEAARKIAAAVADFVNNPSSIAMTLTARGAPIPFTELWTIRDAHTFMSKIDVEAVANR